MVKLGLFSLALALVSPLAVSAQEAQAPLKDTETTAPPPRINVAISTTFPNSELGVKLVNGETLPAVLSITNHEAESVTLSAIAGQLYEPEQGIVVRNLTSSPQNLVIKSDHEELGVYPITLDTQPRDLRLRLTALIRSEKKQFYPIVAHDGPVNIVEPEIGFWAIQNLFLYLILGGFFSLIFYAAYSVWIAPYFPQKRKPGSRTNRPTAKPEATATGVAPEHSAAQAGTTINTDWIPAHHLNPPNARKVRGTGRRRG